MSTRPLSSLLLQLPASTVSAIVQAGYESVQDLAECSPETLAQDINISTRHAQAIIDTSRNSWGDAGIPLTQPASLMASASTLSSSKFPTRVPSVDKLLLGGLAPGQILEISGPPGTPKERVANGLVRSCVENSKEVLFVDAQNMTMPAALIQVLPTPQCKGLVSYTNIYSLPELVIFMHNLATYLESRPKTSLLALNSISFPFQSPSSLGNATKVAIMEQMKQALTIACSTYQLSVVATCQLSTKILNMDGSAGNFDTGSKAVMVPQLGSSYLPMGLTTRIIMMPETRTTGIVRVIASPHYEPGQSTFLQEHYNNEPVPSMVDPADGFVT